MSQIVNVGGKKYRRVKESVFVYVTEKQKRFLDRVTNERGTGGVSATIRMMIESYQKLYSRTTKEFLEIEGPKRGIETNDLADVLIDIMTDLRKGVITGDRLEILIKNVKDLQRTVKGLQKDLKKE